MRSISTLLLLFISFSVSAQTGDRLIVTGEPVTVVCLGISKKAVEKKDTVKSGFVCKTGGVEIVKKDSVVNKGYKGSVCGASRSITGNGQPLFIVDAEIAKSNYLSALNPNDIDSIWILKSATAMALYGLEGYNGAIVISTKKPNTIIIKDFTDGSPIPGATVAFTSLKDKNEKLRFVADDSGIVTAQKLNRYTRYEMTVSAIGYITSEHSFAFNGGIERKVFLNRDAKACDEVIVTTICRFRRKGCPGPGAYTRIPDCSIIKINSVKADPSPEGFRVYPNPVQKGTSLSLQFDNTGEKEKIVRVLSLDGKILLQQAYPANPGKNIFRLPVEDRWAAGTYLVQLLYENGRVLASEKIIIR